MRVARPKVVYWNHSPTPYFVERLNAVVRRDNLDCEAWFNDRRESYRSWDVDEDSWEFSARYIPRRRLLAWRERVPVAELRATRPDLLVQEYDRAHLTAGFLAASAYARRTAFRVLTNYDAWSERTWWREAGKQFVFRAVDGAKAPGAAGAALAERYGLPTGRIERVAQTVDFDRLDRGAAAARADRDVRRAALGLTGCTFVFVGRLWSGKGVFDLLAAFAALQDEGRGCSLLLVGDGPDEQRLRAAAGSLANVAFAGFVQAPELPSWYALADVMVFPTHGDPHGLVVEEAMASGLPVIASAAAGDIEARLAGGDAGLVVAPGDREGLLGVLRELADDPARRERMGRRARELASDRDHRRYAEEFEAFVAAVLARPRRSGAAARAARTAGHLLGALAAGHAPAPPVTTGRGRPAVGFPLQQTARS